MIVEFAFGMFTYIIYFEEKIRILTATKLSQVTFRGAERGPLALVAPSRTVRSFVWKVCWDRVGHIINVDIANAKKIWSPGLFPVVPGINLHSRFPFPEMVPENSQGNRERAVFRLISLPGNGQFLATSLDTA